MNHDQYEKIRSGAGFLAALDQSGGSTPKALAAYGVGSDEYGNDDEMFAAVHDMRTRIVTSPAFNGDRILGAILFEKTMDGQVEGQDTADYLWHVKQVVPFLKVDRGLQDGEAFQLMKPIDDLDPLLARARAKNVFGTKMRSVIKLADADGVEAIVAQQFEIGNQILAAGLVPILEPEVDIHSPQKAEAESLLRDRILAHADQLSSDQRILLKLTLPEQDNLYSQVIEHPQVLRVVALSGGYSREQANTMLSRNHGMVASFSRALLDGLTKQKSDEEFTATLDQSIQSIFEASNS